MSKPMEMYTPKQISNSVCIFNFSVYPTNVSAQDFDNAAAELVKLRGAGQTPKLILSIGGSAYSANFSSAVSDGNIQNFVRTAKAFKEKFGFDGIDIDWEFPSSDSDRDGLTKLVKACHEGIPGSIITLATPAGNQNYQWFDFTSMKPYVDYYNLMAYHFGGSWNTETTHASNLHESSIGTAYSVDRILKDWEDGIGKPHKSVTLTDYKDLPSNGDVDKRAGATYQYENRVFKSYDTKEEFKLKADYVKEKGLAGAFFWEAGRDRKGQDNAVAAFADCL
ncbi:glycoside hydrolase superfamily [Aspergillus cavernicola]|uniref:chitinase n=1 Tax=Aspergillus cavernicola TaxID=176166 RepID=A0ABR4HE53_9EURO